MNKENQWWNDEDAPRKGATWSALETKFLLRMLYEGKTIREISIALMRTPNALKIRACDHDEKIRLICANFDPYHDYDRPIICDSLEKDSLKLRLKTTHDNCTMHGNALKAAEKRISELEEFGTTALEPVVAQTEPKCEYGKYGAWILVAIVYVVTVVVLSM